MVPPWHPRQCQRPTVQHPQYHWKDGMVDRIWSCPMCVSRLHQNLGGRGGKDGKQGREEVKEGKTRTQFLVQEIKTSFKSI